MNKIDSPMIQKLADALADRIAPSPDEIQQAMWLAYNAGKNDGELAMAERLLQADKEAPKVSA